MPKYLDIYEEPHAHAAQPCFLCGAKDGDGHWSNCPFGSGDADTDPDADEDLRALEIL